jgi:hypothetical protein
VQDQIADSKRTLQWLYTIAQEEEDNINQIQSEKIRLKSLVKLFKDNDEEYLKIMNAVEDKVSSFLSDGKGLLRLAFYSLIELIRQDPEKYSALIHYASNNSFYGDQYYTNYFGNSNVGYPYQLNSNDSFIKTLESTILEDANELYERLLKEQVNIIITNYVSNGDRSKLPIIPKNSQPVDINKGCF